MNAEGVYRWVGKVMTESTVPPEEPAAEAKLTSEVVIADRENLPFHALAGILPMMTPAELNDLTEDFREHGLRDPIEIYDGQIVEGRNRFVALQSRRGPPEVHRAGGAGRCGRNAGTSTKASVPWLRTESQTCGAAIISMLQLKQLHGPRLPRRCNYSH